MAEGYTKLFSGIVMSTVWTYDSDTKVVWVTLLAMADEHGVVVGTIPGLAKMAGVSVEATRRAMGIFLAPDPDSGSKEFEGRRVEVIDRGWRLLMHAKYRALRSREEKLEADRLRIAARRAAEKSSIVPQVSQKSQNVAEVAQAEAEASADPSGEFSPPEGACDPSAAEQVAAAPVAIREAMESLNSDCEPGVFYGPPISVPPERRKFHLGAKTEAFKKVYAAYPRKDAEEDAAQEFQEAALAYPGGETALSVAILDAFPAMLKRHPYAGPNDKRPYLATVIRKRRWLDAPSAPDDPPSPKASGPPRSPGPTYVRLTRESSR